MPPLSIPSLACLHCGHHVREGAKVCTGCEARVVYGVPWPCTLAVFIPSAWLAVASHRFFYDSLLMPILIGGIVFGGTWAVLSMVFDDRVVFRQSTERQRRRTGSTN